MAAPKKTTRKPTPKPAAALSLAEIGREAAKAAQRAALLKALKAHDWNLTATADALGLSTPSNVIRSIRSLDLSDEYEAARDAGKIRPGRSA